jgi:hypothetical protein
LENGADALKDVATVPCGEKQDCGGKPARGQDPYEQKQTHKQTARRFLFIF